MSRLQDGGRLHVAVGVISNPNGEVLLSRRAPHVHQGGLWEFPGGKVEPGESVWQALCREMDEELGIAVKLAEPLIQVRHDYADRRVLLDVWTIKAYTGQVCALENQPLRWVTKINLQGFAFPAANRPIVTAARLPRLYAIIEGTDKGNVCRNFEALLAAGVSLLQFRLKGLPHQDRQAVLSYGLPLCAERGVTPLVNSDSVETAYLPNKVGLHLSSRALSHARQRPPGHAWVAASCHDLAELLHAQRIGADFAVLAPIKPTTTHPDAPPLGWEKFSAYVAEVNIPVYALGGMGAGDAPQAHALGAQGIAGIRLFQAEDLKNTAA